jgi:hypothetical protein
VRRWLIAGMLAAAALSVIFPSRGLSSANRPETILYTVAPKYSPLAWMRGGERFPLGAHLYVDNAGHRRELVSSFAASADANVSFDGDRILFAGKQHLRNHWQVWEISLASKQLRQVTSCAEDCIRPMYLPEERFVYAHRAGGTFVVEAAHLHDSRALPLTYAPGSYLPTDVLRDGRVLLQGGYPLGAGAAPELYTVYSDGSGLESYRCDHGAGRHDGRQVGSGDIVFARIRGLGRFTSALAREIEVTTKPGEYAGDVVDLSANEWLVSRRIKARRRFELIRLNRESGRATSAVKDDRADVVQPVSLSARPIPNRHPSALHDWNYANLLCLNAYTSKYKFADAAIRSVRLYTQGAGRTETLLGSAPVEKDGSFYLRTPADQPLKIELLDATGRTLKKEAGWFWLRKGEQRICVGCHAGPETAPDNAVPMVLQRSVVAVDMTGARTQAAQGGR